MNLCSKKGLISTPLLVVIVIIIIVSVGTGMILYQRGKTELGQKSEEEKVLSAEEMAEIVNKCEGLKEEGKRGTMNVIVGVEPQCYLAEAIKTKEKYICKEKLEGNWFKCFCESLVDISRKNEVLRKEILGNIEEPYYKIYSHINEYVLSHSEVKSVIDDQCPIDIGEVTERCREIGEVNRRDGDYCYTLEAMRMLEKDICDEPEDECSKCACRVAVDLWSEKSEADRKKVMDEGDYFDSAQITVERLFETLGVKEIARKQCDSVCLFLSPESEALIKDRAIESSMGQIDLLADIYFWDEADSYIGFSCDVNESMSNLCNEIQRDAGVKPTINVSEESYCAYIKLLSKDKYYCVGGVTDKRVETTINPGNSGYCTDNTFICPLSSEYDFDYDEECDGREFKDQLTGHWELKSRLRQLILLSDLYYSDHDTYAGFTVPENVRDIYRVQIEPIKGDKILIYAKSCSEGSFLCIDSSGRDKEVTADSIPKNIYSCP